MRRRGEGPASDADDGDAAAPPPDAAARRDFVCRAAAAIDLALHHGGQLRKQLELRRAFKDGDEAVDLERLDPGDAFDLREAVRS